MRKETSLFVRRSGVSVAQITDWIEWQADAVVQVGIGVLSKEWLVIKDAWPNAKLIGFEPHPEIVKSEGKEYPGVIHPYAISNEVGRKTFYAKLRHKDGSSLFPHNEKKKDNQYPEFLVDVTTLDVFFPCPDIVGKKILLWLDCEGSEWDALKGGVNFLQNVEMINIEMTSNPKGEGWCDPNDTHDWLNDHGFLRLWTHTDRLCGGQCDAVYVRPEIFKKEFCSCPSQVRMWERWKNGIIDFQKG